MKKKLEINIDTVMNTDQGFTLVELLVVIIIVGILTAISLPSFLNQISKANHAEAKNNIANIIISQQARYSEKSSFATDLDQLVLGTIRGASSYTTKKYIYQMAVSDPPFMTVTAESQDQSLKSYSGALSIRKPQTQESFWISILCGTTAAGPANATSADAETCPTGYEQITTKNP